MVCQRLRMLRHLPVSNFISPILVGMLVLLPQYPASGTTNERQPVPPPRCESAPESFVAWQKATVDARIVAIGEAQRQVEEFYQFRSRVFRSLVTNGGFTALAMETGFVEAMNLNDYVMGLGAEPQTGGRDLPTDSAMRRHCKQISAGFAHTTANRPTLERSIFTASICWCRTVAPSPH
jgi:erythromycin esterase-like protein